MPLAIVHRDDDVVVLDKPSGIAVHRGRKGFAHGGDDTVVARLAAEGHVGVHPVHRLDRGTSGVLVCARNPIAAASLGRAFAEGRTEKTYLAIVRGAPPDHVEVDHPVPSDESGPRVPARTTVRRLATVDVAGSTLRETRYSLVEAQPHTGRFHQVRRHLKHLGHPVLGDANYGRGEHNRYCNAAFGLGRLALHASALAFPHPTTGATLVVRVGLPVDLADPAARMGFVL